MRFKTGILVALLSLPILLCPFSRAFAVTATSGNFEFIESAATEAGLDTGDLIATMVGNLTAVTGGGFVRGGLEGSAIALGNSAADNLNALIDSADYPAYDTLTAEQQQSWGTKQNYDSAKFNSLMDAFGLGSSRDGFVSSGGANFEWSQNAKDKLDTLGRIGRNWISGAGNTIQDLFAAVPQPGVAENFVGRQDYALVDSSNYQNWPDGAPSSLYVTRGSLVSINEPNNRYHNYGSSNEVYVIAYSEFYSSAKSYSGVWFFDKVSFSGGNVITSNATTIPNYSTVASSEMYNDQPYYVLGYYSSQSRNYSEVSSNNSQINYFDTAGTRNAVRNAIPLILFGEDLDHIGEYEQIEDYPADIDPEQEQQIYYPSGGITPVINWGDFITKSPEPGTVDLSEIIALLKQFKFYVSGHLKVHDEGVFDSITDLGTLLTGIDTTLKQVLAKIGLGSDTSQVIGDFDFPEFDEKATDLVDTVSDLAPFGSLLLISAVVDMAAATGSIQDPSLVVPFQFMPGEEYSVTLDFSWLDPLKPVINALLIMVLIMTLASVTLRFVELEAAS